MALVDYNLDVNFQGKIITWHGFEVSVRYSRSDEAPVATHRQGVLLYQQPQSKI